jgi:hypothetical protein
VKRPLLLITLSIAPHLLRAQAGGPDARLYILDESTGKVLKQ